MISAISYYTRENPKTVAAVAALNVSWIVAGVALEVFVGFDTLLGDPELVGTLGEMYGAFTATVVCSSLSFLLYKTVGASSSQALINHQFAYQFTQLVESDTITRPTSFQEGLATIQALPEIANERDALVRAGFSLEDVCLMLMCKHFCTAFNSDSDQQAKCLQFGTRLFHDVLGAEIYFNCVGRIDLEMNQEKKNQLIAQLNSILKIYDQHIVPNQDEIDMRGKVKEGELIIAQATLLHKVKQTLQVNYSWNYSELLIHVARVCSPVTLNTMGVTLEKLLDVAKNDLERRKHEDLGYAGAAVNKKLKLQISVAFKDLWKKAKESCNRAESVENKEEKAYYYHLTIFYLTTALFDAPTIRKVGLECIKLDNRLRDLSEGQSFEQIDPSKVLENRIQKGFNEKVPGFPADVTNLVAGYVINF